VGTHYKLRANTCSTSWPACDLVVIREKYGGNSSRRHFAALQRATRPTAISWNRSVESIVEGATRDCVLNRYIGFVRLTAPPGCSQFLISLSITVGLFRIACRVTKQPTQR